MPIFYSVAGCFAGGVIFLFGGFWFAGLADHATKDMPPGNLEKGLAISLIALLAGLAAILISLYFIFTSPDATSFFL